MAVDDVGDVGSWSLLQFPAFVIIMGAAADSCQ